jgi:GDPmannose 4,6-dehydratase
MKKTAMVTGVSGQDGSYLAELLLEKDYRVFGLTKRAGGELGNASHLANQLEVIQLDLSEPTELPNLCRQIRPDEFYNMGAICSVYRAFADPVQTAQVTGIGVLHCLEALKQHSPKTRFVQASSSLIYGKGPGDKLITEDTPYAPTNPYGTSKLFSHFTTVNYRNNFNLFACNAILFNHDSPRHSEDWVLQKIASGAARIKMRTQKKIELGNLNSVRSWGHAKDFMYGTWLMANAPAPEDYILALNEPRTLGWLAKTALTHVGISNFEEYLEIDPQCFSPAEVAFAVGDSAKIREKLAWDPPCTTEKLIREMVDAQLKKRDGND